jgi:hypothetical protein
LQEALFQDLAAAMQARQRRRGGPAP